MRVKCELTTQNPKTFAVLKFLRDGDPKEIGQFQWSENHGQWIANEPLSMCLKLLTSNENWRKGLLGKDLKDVRKIVLETVYAWAIIEESNSKATLKIPKLDLSQDSNTMVLELWPENKPLVEIA